MTGQITPLPISAGLQAFRILNFGQQQSYKWCDSGLQCGL